MIRKIFFGLMVWSGIYMHAAEYALWTKDIYVPIIMDDITMMMPLRPSEVISPKNGATINGNLNLQFSSGSGVEKRYLKVYYSNRRKLAVSRWVNSGEEYSIKLPKDGRYVDVELRSYILDKYFVKRYRFRQSKDPSIITYPAKGSYLSGGVVTFRWNKGTNIAKRYMYVGTSGYGSDNIFRGSLSGYAKTVYGLPKNGETVYVTIFSMIDNKWSQKSYYFKATEVIHLTKMFIGAYLTNNMNSMQKIAPKRVISKLKTKDTLVKSYFKKIRSYSKLLYFHTYQALVIGYTSDNKEIKFYFAWDGGRWVLESVI
jgi:hypothetical protein